MKEKMSMSEINAMVSKVEDEIETALEKGNTDIYAQRDFRNFCINGKDIKIDTDFSRNVGEKAASFREYKADVVSVIKTVAAHHFNEDDEKEYNKAVNKAYNAVYSWNAGRNEPDISSVVEKTWSVQLTEEQAIAINNLEENLLKLHALQQYLKRQVDILFSSRDASLYFFCIARKLISSLDDKWTYEKCIEVTSYFYEDALRAIAGYIFKEPDDDTDSVGTASILTYIGRYANNVRARLYVDKYGISDYLGKHVRLINAAKETFTYLHNRQPSVEEILEETGLSAKAYYDAVAAGGIAYHSSNEEQISAAGNGDLLKKCVPGEVTKLLRNIVNGNERAYYIITHSETTAIPDLLGIESETDLQLAERFEITNARVSQIKTGIFNKIKSDHSSDIRDILS